MRQSIHALSQSIMAKHSHLQMCMLENARPAEAPSQLALHVEAVS